MKKLLFSAILAVLCFGAFAQDYPYQKVMDATPDELEAQKFEYYKNTNQYRIQFEKGISFWASVAVGADMHHKDDYKITVQMGMDGQKASMEVVIYDRSLYENILEFAQKNGTDLMNMNTGKGEKLNFKYNGLCFSVERQKVEVKDTNTVTGSNNKNTVSTSNSTTTDYSYDKFIYTVVTDVEPWSPQIEKQNAKAARRQAKNKVNNSSQNLF